MPALKKQVRRCHTPGCETLGRRGWAKGFCSLHAEQEHLVCPNRRPYTRKTKSQAAGEAGGEAGGEVCEEAHAAGSEEAEEAEDQEEAVDEELQRSVHYVTWFKMCLDITKRACLETDDVEEDPRRSACEETEDEEEDEDNSAEIDVQDRMPSPDYEMNCDGMMEMKERWLDDITTMPEASLGVYVLEGDHVHGVPWQRQCFTLSPSPGEEADNIEPEADEGPWKSVFQNQKKRFPDRVVVVEDHAIEAVRRAGPVRYRPPQKNPKRARLQGPVQEAEDRDRHRCNWACNLSEEWDLSLGWDQNLSHGL